MSSVMRYLSLLLLLCGCDSTEKAPPDSPKKLIVDATGWAEWHVGGYGNTIVTTNTAGPVVIDGNTITFIEAETGNRVSWSGCWRYYSWSSQ